MRRIAELFRVIVISPETLAMGIATALYFLKPNVFGLLGSNTSSDKDVLKWFALAPIALAGGVLKYGSDVLRPASGSNRELYDWPGYWRLKMRVLAAHGFCLLSVCAGLSIWILKDGLSHTQRGFIIAVSCVVSLISFATVYLASQSIREIVDK